MPSANFSNARESLKRYFYIYIYIYTGAIVELDVTDGREARLDERALQPLKIGAPLLLRLSSPSFNFNLCSGRWGMDGKQEFADAGS